MNLHELLFVATHPGEALRAKVLQIKVGCDSAPAPVGTTVEDFPNMPLTQAMAMLHTAQETTVLSGGVPLDAWPVEDQQRLIHGQRPLGHPEHPNV